MSAETNQNSKLKPSKITVYYDGSCPRCVKDRRNYERLAGRNAETVCWFDITDKEAELKVLGIDPKRALTELHVKNENDQIISELDAYILLMNRIWILKPIAWLLGLPLIRPRLAQLYHRSVERRLRREGRYPDDQG